MNVHADQVIKTATAELGYAESPPGSNKTKYGRWYGIPEGQWCAMFVSWCFHQAGATAAIAGLQSGKGFAGTQAALAYAKAHGWLVKTPEPGDIMIHTTVPGKTGHTGIVLRAVAGGCETIEGNTDVSGGRTGGKVMRKTRPASYVAGYIRPRWDAVKPAPVPSVVAPAPVVTTTSGSAVLVTTSPPKPVGRVWRDPVTGKVWEVQAVLARHLTTVAEAEARIKADGHAQVDAAPSLAALIRSMP